MVRLWISLQGDFSWKKNCTKSLLDTFNQSENEFLVKWRWSRSTRIETSSSFKAVIWIWIEVRNLCCVNTWRIEVLTIHVAFQCFLQLVTTGMRVKPQSWLFCKEQPKSESHLADEIQKIYWYWWQISLPHQNSSRRQASRSKIFEKNYMDILPNL